ncbi:MAG: PDZ domain-containing protein [Myxococcota bacterium]
MARALVWMLLGLACSPDQLGCEPRAQSEGGSTSEDVEVEEQPAVVVRGDGETIEYTLRAPDADTHHLEVDAVVPAGGEELLVMMPVWTPGSYLVREYARNVETIRAETLDGSPLEIEKISKNRWRVTGEGELPARIALRYRLYGREMSVRTNFVDHDLLVLNGAPTFLTPVDGDFAYDLVLETPESWTRCVTGLREEAPARWHAVDFDELVDSPIICGDIDVSEVEVNGVPHVLATVGGGAIWDQTRALADVERIIEVQHRFWRTVPYPRYAFLNVLSGGGGGLEHRASTLVMGSRWSTRDDDDYRGWLGLMSHEFFHTWNVKRLRPETLNHFDYENENYVRSLWIVEGITSYYDDLLVRRAGLMTRDQYLGVLSRGLGRLQDTPGRNVQPLSMASYDAWIKFYRPDENSPNATISYYRKGALVAWLLDATIRERAVGKSLDDVMRLAYERYSGETGYTPSDFREVASEVAGEDLSEFFERYVDGTEELDADVALRLLGLRFQPVDEDAEPPAYFGVRTETDHGRLIVEHVPAGSPAYQGGVNVGDELIAIDEERLPANFAGRIARYRAGDEVEVLVSRRGRLRRLSVVMGTRPEDRWTLEVDPAATPVQRRNFQSWLGPESSPDERK